MDLIKRVLDQDRDYSPRTNPHTIKEFLDSTIHTDFIQELAIRIEAMRDVLESGDSKMYHTTQGGIAALRLVAGIFHDLAANAESDNQNSEEERDVIR